MPRFVCHHDGKFFEFSTVVESPVSALMTREEFENYYTRTYGELERDNLGALGMKDRMARAEANGVSDLDWFPAHGGLEPWLRSQTLNYFTKGNPNKVTKFPGLQGFMDYWFGHDDGEGDIVQLEDMNRGGN